MTTTLMRFVPGTPLSFWEAGLTGLIVGLILTAVGSIVVIKRL